MIVVEGRWVRFRQLVMVQEVDQYGWTMSAVTEMKQDSVIVAQMGRFKLIENLWWLSFKSYFFYKHQGNFFQQFETTKQLEASHVSNMCRHALGLRISADKGSLNKNNVCKRNLSFF